MIEMWRSWAEFTPFLAFSVEVRKIIYTTNGIESLNARFQAEHPVHDLRRRLGLNQPGSPTQNF